jgi:polyisoprenoid-binding protein YceI
MTTTSAAAALTRQYQGTDIPQPGTYALDVAHSTVEFVAKHLMVSRVRGRFSDFSGTVVIGEEPQDSHVEVTIDAGSISTGNPDRDAHLRSADFFDVEHHPTLEFRSASVEHVDDEKWKVNGELTIRGVSRPVVLDVEFNGAATTPWSTTAIGFTASTEVDREEWGLTWNAALETGGVVVSKKVRIELEVEANPVATAAGASDGSDAASQSDAA